MIFKVNKTEKDSIQRKISKGKKSVSIIKEISRGLLLLGIIGGGLYALLNSFIPSWSLVDIQGVIQKDYEWIIIATACIVSPCLIFSWCLKALAYNLASSNNTERIEEALVLDKDILRYTFRIIYQSKPKDRNVITLPLKSIQQVQYTAGTKALILKGTFISDYVENYGPNNTSSETGEEINEMLIYDYFKPSLLDILKENGIKIQE